MKGRMLTAAAVVVSLGWLPAKAQTIGVSVTGPGKVTGTGIDCPSDCREDLLPTNIGGRRPLPSRSVVLTARPREGSTFSGWGGACSGTAPTCTLRVSSEGAKASAKFLGPPPPPPPDAGAQPGVPAGGPGPQPEVPGGVGEPANLAGMTLYHNQVRSQVQTSPALPPLTWSAPLAATAAAWGAQCRDTESPAGMVDHNPNRSNGHPYYVGENLFASGGAATAQAAVNLWAGEKSNYNYVTHTCNGVCGHYLQIVWRATREVGCALNSCPSLTYPNTIICNYGPGGNTGGPPY